MTLPRAGRRGLKAARRQRGVAVITALLLTTLAITIVTSLFWQQQVQVRSMENQRLQLQTKWILRGALDWARLILREDKKFSLVDHLGEPWAVKLAETRLDDYIEKGRVDGETTDATLSGNITDAQARYNLRNLSKSGLVDPNEVEILRRLLTSLQQKPELALRIAEAVAEAEKRTAGLPPDPQSGAGTPMHMLQLDDLLAVPGVTPDVKAAIADYVAILPGPHTAVNVNTAPAEVIAAVVPSISVAEAQAIVTRRERAYFRDIVDFKTALNGKTAPGGETIATATGFFLVSGRVKLDRASLQTLALLQRDESAKVTVIWVREN